MNRRWVANRFPASKLLRKSEPPTLVPPVSMSPAPFSPHWQLVWCVFFCQSTNHSTLVSGCNRICVLGTFIIITVINISRVHIFALKRAAIWLLTTIRSFGLDHFVAPSRLVSTIKPHSTRVCQSTRLRPVCPFIATLTKRSILIAPAAPCLLVSSLDRVTRAPSSCPSSIIKLRLPLRCSRSCPWWWPTWLSAWPASLAAVDHCSGWPLSPSLFVLRVRNHD